MKNYLLNMKRVINLIAVVVFVFSILAAPIVRAEPMNNDQLRAVGEYPNWVASQCSASGEGSGTGSSISGDLQSLAKQIISNKNITFDYGPNGPTGTQFKRLADGQKAQTDNLRDVDVEPIMLVVTLHLAQGHKVNLSALTDGSSHTAPTNPHGSGKAIDVNIFDGSHTSGSDSVAMSIINTAAEVLPSGARFGMGSGPFGTKQINGKTFSSFNDNPTHVHIDVMGVSQAADDKAVQDAAGSTASGATGTATGGTGGTYILGDSITARSESQYKDIFQSKNLPLTIDASSSRSIDGAGIDGNKLSGMDAIQQDKDQIQNASNVVVALGTNGGTDNNSVDKVIDAIRKINENAKIYWVDTISVGRTDNYNDKVIGPANKAIYGEADSKQYTPISWFKAVSPDGDPLNPRKSEYDPKHYIDTTTDNLGVHPTPEGSKALANLVTDSLGSGSSPASINCCATSSVALDGKTPAQQAFKYFITQHGLSPIAAAGIVGNMMTESGGNTEKLDTHAHNDISGTHDGIVQWSTDRWAALKQHEAGKDIYDLATQLDYVWYELNGSYKSVLDGIKGASSPSDAAGIFNDHFEVSGDHSGNRETNARKIYSDYGGGVQSSGSDQGSPTSCGGSSAGGNADLKKTVTISTPGKFITLPSHYSCPGRTTIIDSRLAADIAYLVDHYNLCADDGLASGHLSHGAGTAVDMVPKNGNSKEDWKNSAEKAARDMGWFGDGADDPRGSQSSCANYGAGDYGQCMHAVYPDKMPTWLRWLGYNGAFQHGDPWHIYGGAFPHIHIGWDTPNHDGVSPTIISTPRESVYAFPAPIPDDLKGMVN